MADASANVLFGKRIVVTRAPEQSGALTSALQAAGAEVLSIPLIAFAPPLDVGPLDDAIRTATKCDWLLLTSQNVVSAIEDSCRRLSISVAGATKGIAIAAVGPGTADSGRNAGMMIAYVSSKHDGTSMANDLEGELKGRTVLLPRSDLANQGLVELLQKFGARVVAPIAYRTVPTPTSKASLRSLLDSALPDAILFFSPSAVRHFRDTLETPQFIHISEATVFCAIGPTTTAALRDAGAREIVTAADTTPQGVLAALKTYFGATPAGSESHVSTGANHT